MRRGERGMVLMVTLWILAILSLLAVGLGFRAGIELKLLSYQIDGLKAYEIAKAGVMKAINELEKDDAKEIDTIWQCGISLKPEETQEGKFKDIKTGEGSFEVSYIDETGTKIYGIEDLQAKININAVSKPLLQVLSPQITPELADNILEWRGGTNIPSSTSKYSDKPYAVKKAPFDAVRELLLVEDITPQILYGGEDTEGPQAGIVDCITIYGPKDKLKLNINTAGSKELEVLSFGESAQKVIAARAGDDGDIMNRNDNSVFTDVFEVKEFLKSPAGGGMDDTAVGNLNLGDVLVCSSNYFRIRSAGRLDVRKAAARKTITCIVKRDFSANPPVEIIGWSEE